MHESLKKAMNASFLTKVSPDSAIAFLFPCLLGCALCLALPPAFAQSSWEPVDDFPGDENSPYGATGYGIGSDGSDNLFSVGGDFNQDRTYKQGVIRKSTDGGATWVAHNITGAMLTTFASDSDRGILYAGGTAEGETWVVYRSTDNGDSWHSVDVFPKQPGFPAYCSGLAVDVHGDVYAVGRVQAGKNQMLWTVRKSSDGGLHWDTVEALGGKSGMNFARGVACDSDGGVFVAGYLTVSGGNVWTVRRSLGSGRSWSTVDTLMKHSTATDVTVDPDTGEIYVVGGAMGGTTWIVRKSSDGVKWETSETSTSGMAWGVTVANRTVYVAGFAGRWMVRRLAAGSSMWELSDDFQLAPGQRAEAYEITADSSGNVFATGYANDASGTPHWITRKLSAP